MDRRSSWPWKKKPFEKKPPEKTTERKPPEKTTERKLSEKTTEKKAVAPHPVVASLHSAGSQGYQKKTNYGQISLESYSRMAELEDQVKKLNDQIKVLTENLSSAHSDMTIKDDLLNQHVRVAEEAVSGWEKAEAEALALKHQLEFVTNLKLNAEDRASDLDSSLNECKRQMQNLKEEHEQRLNEIVLNQTNEWDKIKIELQTKINDLDQALNRSSDENAALSRALQERSDMLMKVSEEKSQAMTEMGLLQSNIQSCEREISSLNYELHIVSKELAIRNEEKNLNFRSSEVSNMQYIEGVKKVGNIETEGERLRSLARKRLPEHSALAQMSLEVENMCWDHDETRLQWSPVKSVNSHSAMLSDFCHVNIHQSSRDAQFLVERMSVMEEETKILHEALAKRNNELQASRNLCAKTANKLHRLEAQLQVLYQQKSSEKSNIHILVEGSSTHLSSYPSSVASVSEEGVNEGQSSAESKASATSVLSYQKDWDVNKDGNKNHLEFMDEFLEMERLAFLSPDSNGALSISERSTGKRMKNEDHKTLFSVEKDGGLSTEKQFDFDQSENFISSGERLSVNKLESDIDQVALSELRSRISMIFESDTKDAGLGKILQDIKLLVQDVQESLPQRSISCVSDETQSPDAIPSQKAFNVGTRESMGSRTSLTLDSNSSDNIEHITDQTFKIAIMQIHDYVKSLGKEAISFQEESFDGEGISHIVEEFCDSIDEVLYNKRSVVNFILNLSCVLAKANELSISVPGHKSNEREINISGCIDKVALPENKEVRDDPLRKTVANTCTHACSISDPEVHSEGYFMRSGYDFMDASWKGLLEELEQLKSAKANMEIDLARCTETLESTKLQLQQTEQLVADLKLQLASSQKSHSLTETQLKCMAESYTLLEKREQDLRAAVSFLRGKTLTLNNQLQEERQKHQGPLDKFEDLQEQIERNEGCPLCYGASTHNAGITTKQEREIIAATEKLVECQENIYLIDRQLKALRPPVIRPPKNERHNKGEVLTDYDHSEMEIVTFSNSHKESGESPSCMFTPSLSSSDTETDRILRSTNSSKNSKLRHTKSSSASMLSTLTSESHKNGFCSFFSSKPRHGFVSVSGE